MRIVEKVLYGLGGLLALMLLFIALCHYNPQLAEQIGGSLAANTEENDGAVPEAGVEENDGAVPEAGVEGNDGAVPEAGVEGNDGAVPEAGAEGNDGAGLEVSAGVNKGSSTNSDVLVRNTAVTVGELPSAENTKSARGTYDAENDKLQIPQKVAGLSGYIPVKATGTEITQDKADEIASELSKGQTGENLTFDTEIYPYYGIINDTQKAVYRQIYANANAENKHFAPVQDITANDLKNAFTSVVNDHPELFWVETAYKYKYTPKGCVADITLVFNITANDLDASKAEFEAAAGEITDETYGYYTDYEKEKIAHDTLIGRVKYDANAPMNQSAYSALVYGRTVCAGYARAFQYVLQQLDIPCYYVTGYAGEDHAWNIVKLDDGYYNVDSTWDDTNPNTYDYFNCSDADYASDHVRRDLSIYLPPCNGNKYSGLEVNPSETPSTDTTATRPSTTTQTTATTTQPTTNQSTSNQTGSNQTDSNQTTAANTDSITVMTVRGGGDENYIDNVDDYFNECFAAMIDNDSSTINFDLIITDKKLWDKIYKAYDKGECQEGYIDRYLVEKHKNACSMYVEAVPRTDGSYLLRHRAVIN